MSPRDAMPEENPDCDGAVAAGQVEIADSETSRLALGVQRVREYAARAERERGAALRLRGRAHLPLTSAAEQLDELVRPCWASSLSAASNDAALDQIDASLWAIRDALITNPLWVQAVDIEFGDELGPSNHLQCAVGALEPELAPARDAVARGAGKLLDAEAALREWESRPEWLRTVQGWLLDTEQRLHRRVEEARAEVRAAQTALDEGYARALTQANEAKTAEENADRKKREGACFHREVLEIPLREALLERAMLNDKFRAHDVQPLREAPPDQALTMMGLSGAPGFTVVVLESPTATYVTDWTALSDQAKADVRRSISGDQFQHGLGEDGTPTLRLGQLAPLRSDLHDFDGVVGATHHRNGQLVEFQLIDASGTARWVKPSRGDDLLQELRGDDVREALVSGNRVRIQNREVHILARPRSPSLER